MLCGVNDKIMTTRKLGLITLIIIVFQALVFTIQMAPRCKIFTTALFTRHLNKSQELSYPSPRNSERLQDEKFDFDSLFFKVNIQDELDHSVNATIFDPLPEYKNPCWMSTIHDDDTEIINSRGIATGRLRCFPYAILIGVSKSGTTDLSFRINQHPDIFKTKKQELRFWNRQRIGRLRIAKHKDKTFTQYLNFLDDASEKIFKYQELQDGRTFHPGISVETTPHYLWDYEGWEKIPANVGLDEPKLMLAHSLFAIRPELKIIVILRNPTDRLFSQFHMLSYGDGPEVFHELVIKTLGLWESCMEDKSLRQCAYNATLIPDEYTHPGGMTLRAGMYAVFLQDWLQVFPMSQFHIIKAEDYYADVPTEMHNLYDFLGVRPLSRKELQVFENVSVGLNAMKPDRSKLPMIPETRKILDAFYEPFNKKLAKLLNNDTFLWK